MPTPVMMLEFNERERVVILYINGLFDFPENNQDAKDHRHCDHKVRLVVDQIKEEDGLEPQIRVEYFDGESFILLYLIPDFELVLKSEYF